MCYFKSVCRKYLFLNIMSLSLSLSLSEEKAKLLRDVVAKIEDKNQILE